MNSGTDSAMTYLVPSTSVMTVSGVQSARSMRSGLRANTAPLRRVTRIKKSVPVASSGWGSRPWLSVICHFGPSPVADERASVALRVGRGRDTAKPGRAVGPSRLHAGVCYLSALEVHELLEDLVGGGDDPAVGLEATLGD